MIPPQIATVLFWSSALLVVYTFIGYPALMEMVALWRGRVPVIEDSANPPAVSIVLVVYNEAARIAARLENFLASRFPAEEMELIVVSDGSTDDTERIVASRTDSCVRLLVQPERSGKALGLNKAIAAARNEIIVFADARQRFAPNAISRLAKNFADAKIGAVSGNHTMEAASSNVGGGVDLYWRLEKRIRQAESRVDSSIGCTGAIYAIRRQLFREIPGDTILDDVVIPMQIAVQGYRVIFEPEAECFDPQPADPVLEKSRKRRTLAGNFQMLFRYPQWLCPWKNRLWWQLISHKYLRIVAPLFLAVMMVANVALAGIPFYRLLLAGQCLFYGLAALGAACHWTRLKVFSIPAGFCFLNWMTVGGFWNYMRGSYRGGRWR